MKIGFVGLGSVGGKLAGSLLRNGADLTVLDLDPVRVAGFCERGAASVATARELIDACDTVITCLPSPAASAAVLAEMMPGFGPGKIWMEMSTTDASEMMRIGAEVEAKGAMAIECPVSGGCHRASTGNISIFAAGPREAVDQVMPLLTKLGRNILYTGAMGTASKLKVMTNYLATVNLLSLCEALVTMKAAGLDMATTYEAIRISSGNSFVHETESQLLLSGSRNVDFSIGLILKDIGLFQALADAHNVPLEISPETIRIMRDGAARFGMDGQTDRIIERLEEAAGVQALAEGFPMELVDNEPEGEGAEVFVRMGKALEAAQ